MISKKKCAILYNQVHPDSKQDELDVLVQVKAIKNALIELNYLPVECPASLNLQKTVDELKEIQPDFVFNLIESLGGTGGLISSVPALLDYLKMCYTGSGSETLYITTNKVLCKKLLKAVSLPTPHWLTALDIKSSITDIKMPAILKPVNEDASLGLDEDAIVYQRDMLENTIIDFSHKYGECFAEEFINGREFNISILASLHGPQILPVAEMCFVNYPEKKPKIVDYKAKWIEDSFEYQNTVRKFNTIPQDGSMHKKLFSTTLKCWDVFNLRGYARVDYRVDKDENIWILEINANPCISPDSGFIAAAEKAGLSYEQVIARIVRDSFHYESEK